MQIILFDDRGTLDNCIFNVVNFLYDIKTRELFYRTYKDTSERLVSKCITLKDNCGFKVVI